MTKTSEQNADAKSAPSTFTHIGDVRDHAMVFNGRHTFSGSTIGRIKSWFRLLSFAKHLFLGGIHNHNTGQGTMYNGNSMLVRITHCCELAADLDFQAP